MKAVSIVLIKTRPQRHSVSLYANPDVTQFLIRAADVSARCVVACPYSARELLIPYSW